MEAWECFEGSELQQVSLRLLAFETQSTVVLGAVVLAELAVPEQLEWAVLEQVGWAGPRAQLVQEEPQPAWAAEVGTALQLRRLAPEDGVPSAGTDRSDKDQ